MSHTLTPVAQYDGASLVISADGEVWGALVGPAPFKAVFQRLVDRDELALGGIASRLAWSDELSVAPGGSNSSFSIGVGAIQTIVLLRSDSSYHGYFAGAATITAANLETGSTLSNSTWYYIYAHDASGGGSVLYQISTTAPRASQMFKNSVDGNFYRYLGCFRTNSSGAPIPMRMRRGRYVYRLSATNDCTAYTDSTAHGTAFDVSLASLVPPHVRLARVQAIVVSSGGDTFMSLRTKGDTTGLVWRQQAPDGTTTYGELDIETDASQVVQLFYDLNGGSGNAAIRVAGFSE